jgi:hypothetical protein
MSTADEVRVAGPGLHERVGAPRLRPDRAARRLAGLALLGLVTTRLIAAVARRSGERAEREAEADERQARVELADALAELHELRQEIAALRGRTRPPAAD